MGFPVSVAGSRFGIRTTSPAFGAWLEEQLTAYRQVRPARFKYSAVVQEPGQEAGKRPVHVLYRWTGVVLRTTSILTLAEVLLEELEGTDLSARRDAVYLPGGVFSVDGRAALVPLTAVPVLNRAPLRAWRAGISVSGGVAVGLEPASGRAVPIDRGLRVPPDALARLPGRDQPDPSRLTLEGSVDIDAVLRLGPTTEEVVRPDSRANSLYQLVPQVLNLRAIGKGTAVATLGQMMAGARAFVTGAHRPIPTLNAFTEVMTDLG